MSRLNLSLLENAINFAEDALSNAVVAEEAPPRWKFAILSLVQAIELSLKELLRRQHPYLIYTNVDKPDKTVGIEQATTRLRNIAGVNLTTDESSALRTAVNVRNSVVHHHVDEALADLKLVFARLLGFLNDFHRKHLDEALQDAIDDELWRAGRWERRTRRPGKTAPAPNPRRFAGAGPSRTPLSADTESCA